MLAEVIRDGTIGPDRSVQPTGPDYHISEALGELRGGNLFHSFAEFDLSQNQSAIFTGPEGIDNIITRVTGPNASLIDGRLSANFNADLYIMNPHGILFGPHARLDLHGSFYASTAERLKFSNGEVFGAIPESDPPLLSISPPEQFGFLGASAAPIELHGSRLESSHAVTLNADSIALSEGATIVTTTDRSDAGGAAITLLATKGISLNGTGEEGAGAGLFADSKGEEAAGAIRLEAPSVELRDGAILSTNATGPGHGGTLAITASERVTLAGHDRNGTPTRIQVQSKASGNAGMIKVDAPVIELQDGAELTSMAHGTGSGGELLLAATERITLSGTNRDSLGVSLQAGTAGRGKGGTISVEAPVIEFKDGANANTSTLNSGQGGDLLITAQQRVTFSGMDENGLGVRLQSMAQGDGSAGAIHVSAPDIELRDGTQINTSTEGAGHGGDLVVSARDRLTLSGVDSNDLGARLKSNTSRSGDAGTIQVTAPVIALRDGAAMESNTELGSTGRGGTLTVTASEELTFSGTDQNGVGSSLQAIAKGLQGMGGTLHAEAPTIELTDGAFLTAKSMGSSTTAASANPAPNSSLSDPALVVKAGQRLTLSGENGDRQGSRIETTAQDKSHGRALIISAPVMQLKDGAVISSASFGEGTAGAIQISAEQSLELTNGSQITSSTLTTSGGDININSGHLLYLSASNISTGVRTGKGKGGNIVIEHDTMILDRSNISAHADRGTGGKIYITADSILKSSDSSINAKAGPEGVDGEIVTLTPENDPTQELVRPNTAFVNASALLRPRCDARGAQPASRFHLSRQQGLPLSPEDVLMAFDPLDTLPRDKVSSAPDPNVLAAAAFQDGRFEQAGDYWSQASERANHDGDAHAQGGALRGVAVSQQARGQYAESVQTLEAALKQAAAAQDKSGLIAAQGQLANAYMALGEMDAAEPLLREAIERAVAASEEGLAATLLNNLGNLYMVRQRYDEAARAYTDGTHHAERANDHVQRAKTLSNAARAVLEQDQPDAAWAHLNQARTAAYALTPGHDKIAVLIHVAKTAERLSVAAPASERAALAAAYTVLREAAQLSREIGDARHLSYALGNLGRLYQREQRLAEALYLTRLAEQAAEDAGAPEALFRWHWQAGQVLWAQDEAEAALQSYRRAVAILEDSRQETLAQYGAAPVRFRQAVAPVYEDLVDALLQRAAQLGEEDAGVSLLLEARATVEQFRAAELRDYFRDECVIDLEAKNTRLEAVAKKVAVVYPIVLPERLELLVSLPGGLKRYTVPIESAKLWRTVRRFREAVEMRDAEVRVRGAGGMLYEWLVQPFAQELDDVDTLVFVPGGALRTAPLAALYDGEDYLVRRFRVVVTPGLSLTDPRPLKREGAQFVMAGLSVPVQDFPALPAVPRELEAVQQLYGGRILLDREFTSDRLKQSLERPVTVLHIASHAQFTGEDQSSFLLTYDGRLSMADLDRYLGVTRFRDQPLELLVLSACDTANGNERAALGLVGVGIKAGARSAMGSLWAIDDKAAAELVMAFYRGLKAPGVTKAEALQAAQWEMLGDRRYEHPYYWSAYVLVNNWL